MGADFVFENATIGKGHPEVVITYNGLSIPAQINPTETGKFRISFKPIGSGVYIIRVYYEGQEIQGSPFTMEVIDAKDVKTSGEGLTAGEVGQRSSFYLNLGQHAFPTDVKVIITSPRGTPIQQNIYDRGGGNVLVEFSPIEAGTHSIDVRYFDKPVMGSPFCCQVTDGNQIMMLQMPPTGSINRPVEFEIDASRAGQGKLEISVNDGRVPCVVDKQGGQRFRGSFTPVEGIPHIVRLRFNDREVPGSPWTVEVRNPANTAVVASNFANAVPVNQSADLEVRLNSIDSDVTASVTTPNKQNYPGVVTNLRNGYYRVEFIPREAGTHLVQVMVDGAVVPGSPYVFKAYNPNAIIVTPPGYGTIGSPVEFSIDASKAGEGQLEIMVNKGNVSNVTKVLSKGVFLVSFLPLDPRPHIIDVLFNREPVPNTPLSVPVMDSRGTMVTSQGNSLQEVALNRHSIFRLHQNQTMQQTQQQQQQYQQMQPQQAFVEEEMVLKVTAPNGELVPAKMIMQPDGEYKLDYMSKYTGRHRVEITSGGQPIIGSPFYVEIYDPNKVKVEGKKKGMVGEQMQLDIITSQAGKAELKVSIKGPRGNVIRHEAYKTTNGEKVWYTPHEPGVYQIYILFGGLNVPGCPIKQEISDSSIVIAEGEGLIKGLEDHPATFYVDSRGQKGDLKVQVEGPNSIAKVTVTQDYDGRHEVSYVPVEPGLFMVAIKWNGREIEGSPFRPRISALQNVRVVGGWDSLLDANNNMLLRIDETKAIEFDARGCGQGQLTASLVGPSGVVPVDVRMKDKDIYSVSFTPREEGEHRLKVFWNGNILERSPMIGVVKREMAALGGSEVDAGHYARHQKMTTSTVYQANSHQQGLETVLMTGVGLQQAVVNQQAEFHIDGTKAGPGSPIIKMEGPTGNVDVQCLALNPCVYKCTYYPPVPGIYSIHVKWGDRDALGSPFKVNVQPPNATNSIYQTSRTASQYLVSNNPQLVVTPPSDGVNTYGRSTVHHNQTTASVNVSSLSTADSLTGGILRANKVIFSPGESFHTAKAGHEIRTVIDTRKAGYGVLAAQCQGRTKFARCKLVDPKGYGVYFLFVEPIESGLHELHIKWNKEHIEGSPFTFRVSSPTDPSRVRCSGPGIKSGQLRHFSGVVYIDTEGAGAGQIDVKVTGPRGGFTSQLYPDKHFERRFTCSFEPSEPGEYIINVKWSGVDVPGSPFVIKIVDSEVDFRGNTVYGNASRRQMNSNGAGYGYNG